MTAATFSIRRAEGAESRRAERILLSRAAHVDADVFLASECGETTPIGAGAIWFLPSRQFPQRALCMIQVTESQRRHGVGRALLDELIAAAQEKKVTALGCVPLNENSSGFEFLRSCGFQVQARSIKYEAPLENFAAVTAPVYERLVQRRKIPEAAHIIPLSESRRDEVCRLILDNFGFASQQVANRLRGTEHGFSQTLSRVALLEDQLVGALLISYQNARASVDATAVVPEHRHTWVNAALKHSAVQELMARGVALVSFSANSEQHRDTVKLAQRTRASVVKTVATVALPLPERA